MTSVLFKSSVISGCLGNRQILRLRAGVIITVATIAIGILVLSLEVRAVHGAEAVPAGKHSTPLTITVFSTDPSIASRSFRVVLLRDDPSARIQGLQGFRRLKPGEAVLFIFEKPAPAVFWMGSVSYPIDIIFVGPDKKVLRTFPSCQPASREIFPSGDAIKWVIETAAGSGIRVGDRIRF